MAMAHLQIIKIFIQNINFVTQCKVHCTLLAGATATSTCP